MPYENQNKPFPDMIRLPYGEDHIEFSASGTRVVGIYTPNHPAPAEDPARLIRDALDHPIESPPLTDIAAGKRNALILIDDITRETPAHILLPPLIDDLESGGIKASNITVLIALGTHRPMSNDEIIAKVGRGVLERVEVLQHDHRTATLRNLGETPNQTPVEVNQQLFEFDLVLGTGAVVPHHIAGFSAGAKIVQPGVSGAATTAATHMFSARAKTPLLGQIETPVRKEMELIADRCGMTHILNVTLNPDGQLVNARFGAMRQTFRKAVTDARKIYGVPTAHNLDVVVASSHPCDIEFWQAHKSLYPSALMVRPGGSIIVVTPCPEGVTVTHRELLKYAAEPAEAILHRYETNQLDDRVAASLAVAWARVREQAHVILVSDGITNAEALALGFERSPTVEEALSKIAATSAGQLDIGVLTHAPDTLPLLD
ncbi:MAG TPA: nickel-dependent lactate racemase [Chloroflexi bacterium]|nr:nickel-dependent lactate racemase [Chloroflexota bacterium]|tara:strand:+ start:7337 stop:8629 length:1293 start_codon:yes stop_codon:yes gene_type:complete